MKNTPISLLATVAGLGRLKPAPGTWGTLGGIPLALAIASLHWPGRLLVIVLLFAAGVWICQQYQQQTGRHDAPEVVFDEVVGYLVTILLFAVTPLTLVLAFVWFRFFDILKPWPIGWVDARVDGGLGVMLDDVLAGVFAAAGLALTLRLLAMV